MKQEKKYLRRNLVLAILAIMAFVSVIWYAVSALGKAVAPKYAPTLSQQITEVRYVLKLYNGKVAVFREGEEKPEQITDIAEYSLCNFDREQLSEGVAVLGDIELAMRLEDYGS